MDTALIARNILILDRLAAIGRLFAREHVPVAALKGAALIAAVPEYLARRHLEDIDLLVRPCDRVRARDLLVSLGYRPAPRDPSAFTDSEGKTAVDCHDTLWYLDRRGNERLWEDGTMVPMESMPEGVWRLSAADMYVHVLAHAAVHHARRDEKWMEDLEVMERCWKDRCAPAAIEAKLRRYGLAGAARVFLHGARPRTPVLLAYRWLLSRAHPEGGHIARVLFMPFDRKVSYVARALFPADEFLVHRYGVSGPGKVWFYRVCRPLLLIAKLLAVPLSRRPASADQ
jgi:hypothetical protein